MSVVQVQTLPLSGRVDALARVAARPRQDLVADGDVNGTAMQGSVQDQLCLTTRREIVELCQRSSDNDVANGEIHQSHDGALNSRANGCDTVEARCYVPIIERHALVKRVSPWAVICITTQNVSDRWSGWNSPAQQRKYEC